MAFKIVLVSVLVAVFCTELTCAALAYQTSALNAHNQYRQKHHSPPLRMDETLNAAAVKCADYYARRKSIDHSCPHKGGAGENLIVATWTPDQFATMGTKLWYDEVSRYNYNNPGFSAATGHFTQVVWKSSTNFGFGVITITVNGYTAGVGLYNPHGNFQGQFPQNVLRP